MKPALFTALLACLAPACALASDADLALNENYKALMNRLEDGNRDRLRDAQHAWLAFRDKECAFKAQGLNDAATAQSAHEACLEELSALRAEQLKRELDCDAEDVTCVPRRQVAAAAPDETGKTCTAEVGATKAEQYVAQCQQVSPATHPPCNVANACALMIDEIKRSCAMLGKDAPAFCAGYR